MNESATNNKMIICQHLLSAAATLSDNISVSLFPVILQSIWVLEYYWTFLSAVNWHWGDQRGLANTWTLSRKCAPFRDGMLWYFIPSSLDSILDLVRCVKLAEKIMLIVMRWLAKPVIMTLTPTKMMMMRWDQDRKTVKSIETETDQLNLFVNPLLHERLIHWPIMLNIRVVMQQFQINALCKVWTKFQR